MVCPPDKLMSFHKKEAEKIELVARPGLNKGSNSFIQTTIGIHGLWIHVRPL